MAAPSAASTAASTPRGGSRGRPEAPAPGRGPGRSPRRWRFYKQAWQHWSETKTVVGPYALTEDAAASTSDLVGLVSDVGGRSALLGFVTAADQLSQVQLGATARRLTAVSCAHRV